MAESKTYVPDVALEEAASKVVGHVRTWLVVARGVKAEESLAKVEAATPHRAMLDSGFEPDRYNWMEAYELPDEPAFSAVSATDEIYIWIVA